jgi:uncharacterized protein
MPAQTNPDGGWNPYLAGALSGVVSILSVWTAGKYLGASTTFVKSAGMLEKIFSPDRVAHLDYFRLEVPQVDWQWMFVIGIFFGSMLASLTDGSFRWQSVPDMWNRKFGPSLSGRGLAAFGGGVIAMFGARLAGGCPSGHGLSGTLQLAVSGILSLICFFISGFFTARLIYGARKSS